MLDDLGLARAADGHPDGDPGLVEARELTQHREVVQDAAGEGRGVDLVEAEVGAHVRLSLLPLALQHGERMLLDLVDVGVDLPIGGVGVAPF